MKHLFPSLNRWAVLGFLLLSGLFGGCHDPYDDTAIVERLENLEERVTKLEEDYQEQVEAISALSAMDATLKLLIETNTTNIAANAVEIDGLLSKLNVTNTNIDDIRLVLDRLAAKDITLEAALDALGAGIINYVNENGKVTILFSDGKTLEFLTGDNAVDAVKVKVAEDGKSYWAVGGEFIKDANGNKVPVTVTPQVKVNPETREVSISPDGGVTWYATGIIDEEVLPLFLSVESDDDYVYFTLADGTKLSVARSTTAIEVVIPAMKMYVSYGETRTLDIEMTNVEKFIIVKPEGWRASIKDGVLSVTAPAEGVGETEGYVQIFTVAADGRSAIYEVKVVAGEAPLKIAVKSNGTFDIAVADEEAEYLYGAAVLDGTTLEDVYEQNCKGWAAEAVKSGAQAGSIAEILGAEALESGKEYVVWAIMLDADGEGYKAQAFEDMYYQTYVKAEVKFTFSDVTGVDAKIKIESSGNTGKLLYYIQPLGGNVADMTAAEKQQKIDAQIKSATSTSDVLADGKYEGSLLTWYKEYYMASATFTPGHTIFVAVVPEDNKTAEGVVYELVTLEGYKLGETNASVTFGTPTENYTTLSVRITPAAGTYFRFNYMTEEKYKDEGYEGSDEDLMTFAVGEAKVSGEKKVAATASPYPVVLGQSYIVVVYAYDPATAVGKVFTKKLTCPAIVYNDAITLNLEIKHTGVNYVEAMIEPVGGNIKSIRYAFMRKADFEKNTTLKGDFTITEEKMVTNQTVSNRKVFNTANLKADHIYSIENMYLMEESQYLFVIAFDENDKPVHMKHVPVDTKKVFEDGFDANLVKPEVKEVYYISSSTGYKQALSKWSKMSEVDDITALNGMSGMYWLDLDWGAAEMKRMWLSNENSQNWTAPNYVLTGDPKADAISVLKKRAGFTASGVSPDFYGLNATTGAPALSGVEVWNTSEYKALRNKEANSYSAKKNHLVWETADGKYGYMVVTPEDFCPKTSGVETWGEGGKIDGWK